MVQTVLATVVAAGAEVKVVALGALPPDSKHSFLTANVTYYVFMLDP